METFKKFAPHSFRWTEATVAIAGILMKPECILDEPTAMLDPLTQTILNTVKDLNQREGVTTICVTHFMERPLRRTGSSFIRRPDCL